MGKIVAAEYLSVDGVMQDPAAWTFPYWNDELAAYQSDQLFASDALRGDGAARPAPSRRGRR